VLHPVAQIVAQDAWGNKNGTPATSARSRSVTCGPAQKLAPPPGHGPGVTQEGADPLTKIEED